MKNYFNAILIITILFAASCTKIDDNAPEVEIDLPGSTLYFPAVGSNIWETTSADQLNWNTDAEAPLISFLEDKGTKAFLMLKDGKLAVEAYFGTFTQDSLWYWASAGKTLTCFTVALAQEQGLLDIGDKTSDYLGTGWTSIPQENEDQITIYHQLSMTSGLNELFFDCISPNCLLYQDDAGNRWAYHNGPYTLLQDVVAGAAGENFEEYFNRELRNKIGMDGFWFSTNGQNNVFFSTARSMARFGLLVLNNGQWDQYSILGDQDFQDAMRNSSLPLNQSYGYLWWLAGEASYRIPGSQQLFNGSLIPNAPDDLYAGLGKNDQKLYIVPSKNLVIVRMGESAGEEMAGPSSFDNELWEKINALIELP